jgi:hypothetical protein
MQLPSLDEGCRRRDRNDYQWCSDTGARRTHGGEKRGDRNASAAERYTRFPGAVRCAGDGHIIAGCHIEPHSSRDGQQHPSGDTVDCSNRDHESGVADASTRTIDGASSRRRSSRPATHDGDARGRDDFVP